MNRPRPCWAPPCVRPKVAAQLIREYIYLYGAVCPKDGTCVYLVMPTSDTACFQVFLDFKNYALKSMAEVHEKLEEAILYVDRNPKLVKSITSFPYIVRSF